MLKFLHGLKDTYEYACSQIILTYLLSDLNEAYARIGEEETKKHNHTYFNYDNDFDPLALAI